MMKKIMILALLSFGTFISSCDDERTTLSDINGVVVEAYLNADRPLTHFRLTQLIPLGSTDTLTTIDDAFISISNNGNTYELLNVGDGFYENTDLIIQSDETYELSLEYFDTEITATTYVPSKLEGLTISDTEIFRTEIADFSDLQNQTIPEPTEVSWDNLVDSYYFVSIKNLENEPKPINTLFEEFGFEFPELVTPPEVTTNYFINQFGDITHFGDYEVVVFKVNPEYAELYQSDDLNTNSLSEAATNIENGYGIFTGINSDTISFKVKEL